MKNLFFLFTRFINWLISVNQTKDYSDLAKKLAEHENDIRKLNVQLDEIDKSLKKLKLFYLRLELGGNKRIHIT